MNLVSKDISDDFPNSDKIYLNNRPLAQLQSKRTVLIDSNSISMVSQQTFLSIVS